MPQVEIVLGEDSGMVARHRHRGHVVERGVEFVSQVDHRSGAVDIGRLRLLGACGHVVHRTEMQDVICCRRRLLEAQSRRGEVPDDRNHPIAAHPGGCQPLHPLDGSFAHQHIDLRLGISFEKFWQYVPTKEAGSTAHHVCHQTSTSTLIVHTRLSARVTRR